MTNPDTGGERPKGDRAAQEGTPHHRVRARERRKTEGRDDRKKKGKTEGAWQPFNMY